MVMIDILYLKTNFQMWHMIFIIGHPVGLVSMVCEPTNNKRLAVGITRNNKRLYASVILLLIAEYVGIFHLI